MLSLTAIRNTGLALSLLLLTGCAEFNSSWNRDSDRHVAPYTALDFDELLAFGANMAQISPSSRTKVCRTLLKGKKSNPEPIMLLHQMVGRLLSDTCGEIPEILEGVGSIPPESLTDERMQKLIAIDTATLKRMQTVSRKLGLLERKQKTVQSVLESKETQGSKKNETRLLREKLEAIRSMEKHLDESDDVN